MDTDRRKTLEAFLAQHALAASDFALLDQALTHPTYALESQGAVPGDNQRLEFLGDAVLGLVTAGALYRRYPDLSEGELTLVRSRAVSEDTLHRIASELGLPELLLLGKGEEKTGGRYRASTLADAFESLLGALYLQLPWPEISRFAGDLMEPVLARIVQEGGKDPKTRLQEMLQAAYRKTASYRILEETGPDHDRRYTAGVLWEDRVVAVGRGRSKKEAETQAARTALEWFQQEEGSCF